MCSNMSARQRHAGGGEPLAALRPDPGGAEPADHLAVRADAGLLEQEDLLHGDDVAFHAGDFGDGRHLARAVGHARHLDDQVDGRRDLLPDRPFRDVQVRHRHHRVETVQGVAGVLA